MAEPRQDFKETELSSYIRNQGPPGPKDKPYAPGFGWLGIVDISVVGQLSSLGSLLLRGQWEGGDFKSRHQQREFFRSAAGTSAVDGCHLHYCKSHMNGVPGS